MKKYIDLSFGYAIAGILCGVFYREATKLLAFTGKTTLAFTHLHLLVLGTVLFLVIALFTVVTDVEQSRHFTRFLRLYNVALPAMVVMLMVRGVAQVWQIPLSRGASAAISGVAGIVHILFTISLVLLMLALRGCKAKHTAAV